MAGTHRIVAVIPAYNEGGAIGAVIQSLAGAVEETIVVDDGSRDDTGAVARRAGATVLRHGINRGQGAALATGIRFALTRSPDVIVTFDADGQHRPEDIQPLTAPVLEGRADIALGSRFLDGTSNVPPLRRLLLKAAVVFTAATTGMRLSDAHNGLRALSPTAAARIRIRQDRMAHASEIIAEIRRNALRFVEVPVTVRYTEYSRSKGQSALGALRVLLDLWVGKGVK